MDVTMARSGRREHGLILVLNCGSSSIKFAVFDSSAAPLPRQALWNGKVQGIGVHFNNDEAGIEVKRKIEGLVGGTLSSNRPTHTI